MCIRDSIYNVNVNSNLVKLINLSKVFTNIYKSLLSIIYSNIILNQYLYLKYFLYSLSIQLFFYSLHHLIIIMTIRIKF